MQRRTWEMMIDDYLPAVRAANKEDFPSVDQVLVGSVEDRKVLGQDFLARRLLNNSQTRTAHRRILMNKHQFCSNNFPLTSVLPCWTPNHELLSHLSVGISFESSRFSRCPWLGQSKPKSLHTPPAFTYQGSHRLLSIVQWQTTPLLSLHASKSSHPVKHTENHSSLSQISLPCRIPTL